MAPGGNIIIGHNSGNSGNSNTCMSVEEDTAGHLIRPMGNNISYTNVEIHIGLFGGQIKLPDHKRVNRPMSRLMAIACAGFLGMTLASSTPTLCRHEIEEFTEKIQQDYSYDESNPQPAMLACSFIKTRRRRL